MIHSILVVDSDLSTLDLLKRDLASRGFDIEVTATATDGLAVAAELRPQAIVIGESLAFLGSAGLLSLFRQISPARVIVIGKGGRAAVARALTEGADGYYSVPINLEDLSRHLRALNS